MYFWDVHYNKKENLKKSEKAKKHDPLVRGSRKENLQKSEKPKLSKVAKGANEYIDSRKIPDHAKDEIRRAGVRYLDAYNKAQDHATKADFAPANQVKQHYANYNAAMKKADIAGREYAKVQRKWDVDFDDSMDLDVLESFRDRIKKK